MGEASLEASLCTQTNYTESPLSTRSSAIALRVCLVVHVITGMHSMCVFLHALVGKKNSSASADGQNTDQIS